ncbi:MAG: hypothetical protein K2H41_11920 [Acetatifactor sp.]|nr:hypothetical protein [Acetatifactor sp.]MDE6701897.1 hypothetical protein [Acetatifactor sp.]
MTALLELRDKLKYFYSKNEAFILPVVKFLLAFITLTVLNDRMGYMKKVDNIAIVLVVALMCSFLPRVCIILFGALFSLLHMYALSMEIALVGVIIYMLMFLLFFRFSPKDSLVVVLTPLLCFLKLPYVMPVAMGLLGTPASAVSVACGVVVYYLLLAVTANAPTINTMNAGDATAKLRLVIDALVGNKAMLVLVVAFIITVITVYLIRRMSVDYSWTIAMTAGVILNLVILLVGDLIYETNISVVGAIFGNLLALAAAKVIEFFRFCVDYSRTEKVQFEDDEYYYYVKAIPKMTVAAPTKTVKHINTPRRTSAGTSRSVTAERTQRRPSGRYGGSAGGGRSVTIGNQQDESQDDYEELF